MEYGKYKTVTDPADVSQVQNVQSSAVEYVASIAYTTAVPINLLR